MEKYNLITNSAVELGDDLTTEGNGKGRKFVSKFIEPGVASYEQFGDVLITKETLNKFINTMVGCPVIIKHKDITDKNADKERVGVVSDVWFNETDGWFYCSGIIWDKQAIDLVKNQGWNVSCTYDFESDKESKTHNGKKIDMEFTDGNFLHLALVDNPRYERANIVMNSKVSNEDQWITIKPNGEENKGRHLLIKEGETVREAMERTYGIDGAKGQQKLFDTKGDRKTKEDFKREREEKQRKYDTRKESYYEPDMEEHYTKAYEDSIKKDFEEFMKSRKDEKKETYYEPDAEETYTKSFEENIQKDYEEFIKTQREKKQKQDHIKDHFAKEYEHYKGDKEGTEYLDSIQKSMENVDSLNYSDEDVKKINEYINEAESADYDRFAQAMRKKYERLPLETNDEYFKREKENKPFEVKKNTESPFGEGVKVIEGESRKIGGLGDVKKVGYVKDNKGASVEEWSDGTYKVNFYDGTKLKNIKYYSTKKGMEKSVRDHLQGGANKETKALEVKTDLNAAQARYKDVLSKYNEADRKRWQSGISPQEYHQAWVDAEKYKKELTGARREYAESIMSNFEAVENNPYEERQAERKMRYEEMAAKTEAESNRMAQVSRDMISAIPMGQPILVGHHSEMRDRRYRQRAWDKMDKAYELSKKADYYERKADSVGKAGISADDANAIAKLAQKYKSGVDSAEKRRIIDRVIDIHTRSTSTKPESEQTDYGFSVERNKDLNRLQLKFDNIPDANTRAILKSNGFRWSPREKAWQRQLNGNSEASLKYVMEKMKAENALLEGIEDILEDHNISEEDLPILSGLYDILKD